MSGLAEVVGVVLVVAQLLVLVGLPQQRADDDQHRRQVQQPGEPVARVGLDQDGGASSWYFYTGYNYYSYLNWYGCWYAPYYTYNYGYYTYYYYSNYYGWR